MLALVVQRVLSRDKRSIQTEIAGVTLLTGAHSLQPRPGALVLYRDQQEKPLQHLISVLMQGVFKTTLSLYLYLLKRSSSPFPAAQARHPREFLPLVALERQSYTLCVPGQRRLTGSL